MKPKTSMFAGIKDMRATLATGLTVSTKSGTYTDCVKVYDWTPLENQHRRALRSCR